MTLSPRNELMGFDVVHLQDSGDKRREELVDELRHALVLISDHDRIRFSRVRRYIRTFVFENDDEHPFQCWPDLGACILDSRATLDTSTRIVSTVIVHEATHLRIMQRGVRECHIREEAACYDEMIRFASRLDDADELVAHLHELRAKVLAGTD
jgi:hypothetical protein